MRYVSTRGEAPVRDFAGVLLAGLAEDGGLYVPESWPSFDAATWRVLRGRPYAEIATAVMRPYVGDAIDPDTFAALCRETYDGFGHAAVVPLVQTAPATFVQELFHGPTLAFKDLALQLVGRLFDHVLSREGRRIAIVGATSGDTGSAAIAACAGRARINIMILHPDGRTSAVQRRQMTTVDAANVRNVAVAGTFDDCQDLVKAMFADAPFRDEMALSAVNSINWARIAAQIPYYAAAALALGAPDRPVDVAVPTGNFGNVLAAWAASRMGLPIERLIVGSNRNDILVRFLDANDMSARPVEPSLSPSMDIQVSSNFERLLFELLDRDAAATAGLMRAFRATGRMPVPDAAWRRATARFMGFRLDDAGTTAAMAAAWRESGYLADPHTAVGLAAAARHARPGVPVIVAGTAHPAKFPDAVEAATGIRPALPAALADLFEREEHYIRLPAELAPLQSELRALVGRNRHG
ncbi:threonine synthase [Acidisphaera rubrifaciens]|uniref:Threonine synthase n=1 Tax=Acidisphaera rubrifaciens HS-AP3 TaxID=1231350 RepID=A0A0D6P480_9PROT|nr:threonine synthase [Acidisphaera rubrifaciens]GAN76580.1 threonine synthase [Acidisphaera rubrifaciens HS-AP3]